MLEPRPVNRIIHTFEAQVASGVGSTFHHKEAFAPAVAITPVDSHRIILSNRPQRQDLDEPVWTINSVRVMITRFWSASTAYVTAVIHAPDQGQFVPQPPKELYYEHQFRLWMGFLDRPRFVQPEDLCTHLYPVFLGSVDTRALHCTSEGGYTFSIQARDRMKWFMDTAVSYNPSVEHVRPVAGEQRHAANRRTAIPTRGNIIESVLAMGIGDTSYSSGGCGGVCGMHLLPGESYDMGRSPDEVPPADHFYRSEQHLKGSASNCPTASVEPRLHYIVTRDAYANLTEASAQSIIFHNRVPLEIVKQLAMQEVYVTEVFQDHRNGDIYYTPRANDASALPRGYSGGRDSGGDPKRFFRTYFFKVYPSEYYPDHNQMLTAFKEERSSLGMMNVFHTGVGGAAANDVSSQSVILRIRPPHMPEKFPCRVHFADDETIQQVNQAAAVNTQLARIFGRETRAAMAILRGDPTFTPGEVIQVIGSPDVPAVGGGPMRSEQDLIARMDHDRKLFHARNDLYNSLLPSTYTTEEEKNDYIAPTPPNLPKAYPSEQEGKAFQSVNPAAATPAEGLCASKGTYTELEDDPPTIWRVDAILHKFSFNEGYMTELALNSPF